MTILVDTQCFYWSLCEPDLLSARAKHALQDSAGIKFLSVAVFWEMTIKSALGKLTLPKPVEELWQETVGAGTAVLAIQPGHLAGLTSLPHHHRDPFDRLMIAQALVEGWPVLSSDDQWDAYGVQRIW